MAWWAFEKFLQADETENLILVQLIIIEVLLVALAKKMLALEPGIHLAT
jgi:hypothetical protein